jgi:hypothetical protein
VQTTAPAEPDVTAPQQAQPDSTDSKPLDFSGKRLSGAAMYRKIAAHNNP